MAAREQGVAGSGVGTLREQAQSQVLPADGAGPTPTASRSEDVGGVRSGSDQGAECDAASAGGGGTMKRVPLWRRYARFFGPDPAADAKDELRFHLETTIDELVHRGWTPDAARHEAERRMGDLRALVRIGARIGGKME